MWSGWPPRPDPVGVVHGGAGLAKLEVCGKEEKHLNNCHLSYLYSCLHRVGGRVSDFIFITKAPDKWAFSGLDWGGGRWVFVDKIMRETLKIISENKSASLDARNSLFVLAKLMKRKMKRLLFFVLNEHKTHTGEISF